MTLVKFITLITAVVLTSNFSANAQSKKLLYEGNYDGADQKVYLLNKKLVKQQRKNNRLERIYLTNIEFNYESLIDNSKTKTKQKILFQCSTSIPIVIASNIEGKNFATYIAPWEDPSDTRMTTNRLVWKYWAVCHNVMDAGRYDLRQKAKQYGYRGSYQVKEATVPSSLQQLLKLKK
jgi:hypothetical protein